MFGEKFEQKIEKPLEKPPVAPGEDFKPEEEVKTIRTFPKEEQRQKLEEFKERLAYQKEGLGKVQAELMKTIRANPDMPADQLYERAIELGSKFGINEKQKELAKEVLEAYAEKHAKIKETRAQYPDDKDLYAALFGKKPRGKIEVIEGPMTFYFRCKDIKDYARITSGEFSPAMNPTSHDIKYAKRAGGINVSGSLIPELGGAIIAENSGFLGYHFKPLIESENTRRHEEQHAIKRLFKEKVSKDMAWERFENAESGVERGLALAGYFREQRQGIADPRAKGEILAFFSEGANAKKTFNYLIKLENKKGLYDYLADKKRDMESWMDENFSPRDKKAGLEILNEVYVDEYRQLLRKSIDAIHSLKKFGYSKDKAISVLIHEPLSKWDKTVRRLTEKK